MVSNFDYLGLCVWFRKLKKARNVEISVTITSGNVEFDALHIWHWFCGYEYLMRLMWLTLCEMCSKNERSIIFLISQNTSECDTPQHANRAVKILENAFSLPIFQSAFRWPVGVKATEKWLAPYACSKGADVVVCEKNEKVTRHAGLFVFNSVQIICWIHYSTYIIFYSNIFFFSFCLF